MELKHLTFKAASMWSSLRDLPNCSQILVIMFIFKDKYKHMNYSEGDSAFLPSFSSDNFLFFQNFLWEIWSYQREFWWEVFSSSRWIHWYLFFLSVILLCGTWASHSNLHLKGIQHLKHLPQIAAFWVHLVRGWIIHLSYIHTAQLLEKSLTLPERDFAAVSPDKGGVWFKMFAAPKKFSNASSNDKWNMIYKIWNGINSNLYFSWKIHGL